MFYPFFDSTMVILIPALILTFYAQFKVKSTFEKYSKVSARRGVTASEVAGSVLERSNVRGVAVSRVSGSLTDHYDPRSKTLRLSDSVYGSTSIAAIGVAAHEAGHAIQDDVGYSPLSIRNNIVPVVSICSQAAMPLFFIGLIFSSGSGQLGSTLMSIGIVLFLGAVAFQLITLPVEFNASRRAINMLDDYDYLTDEELAGAKKVLNAAALTYVAAAAMSLAQLMRLLMLFTGGRRRS